MEELIQKFENPDAWYRSFPFWGWNDRMDEQEIRRQIREMKKAGIGGFFLHSREGLETEYMGEAWLDCIKAAVDEAKKQQMYAWLYDEDRWPSGTAGGKVTAKSDAYRCKGLTLEVRKRTELKQILETEWKPGKTDCENGLLALYMAEVSGENLQSFCRLAIGTQDNLEDVWMDVQKQLENQKYRKYGDCRENKRNREDSFVSAQAEDTQEVLLVVRLEVSAPSEWFNYQAPPDNLNPDCVRDFIAKTHEIYRKAVGDAFGKTIPGIFTDEPSLADRHTAFPATHSWIPWTYGYGAYFQEKRGYDFLDQIPQFYFEGSESRRVRHDYWYVTTLRYGESYFAVIGEWCQNHHLAFTGHFLQEDKLGLCVRVNGAVMPNYVYQQIPGIDMLCEKADEYITVKQCTSVAHQFGKKNVLTETYGCTGWDFTFEGQKWMGDWQYVLGVNRRCQHIALYSIRGCRKRDYPPSFNYQSNWWGQNQEVETYFGRLGVMLETGQPVRRVLLLHPLTTAWSLLGASPYGNPVRRNERDVPKINAYGNVYNRLIETLCRHHFDCDLGDEILMGRHARAENAACIIGEAAYDVIVVPQIDTLMKSTCALFEEYLRQGGKIVWNMPEPFLIEGMPDEQQRVQNIIRHPGCICVNTEEEILQALEMLSCRTVRITAKAGKEEEDILYQLRETGEYALLFVVNHSRERRCSVDIQVPYQGSVCEWDCMSGERRAVEAEIVQEIGQRMCRTARQQANLAVHQAADSDTVQTARKWHCVLEPVESKLYVIRKEREVYELSVSGEVSLSHPNAFVLDRCRYQLEGAPWSEQMEVWQAQREIRKKLGMRQIYQNGQEQRYRWYQRPHENDGTCVKLEFSFESQCELEHVRLAVEGRDAFQLQCNGQAVEEKADGWFLDRAFQTVKLPKLCKGNNQIVLICLYTNAMELENLYLTGPFGVGTDRKLRKMDLCISEGDWTRQGLLHYCGNVTYHFFWNCEEKKKDREIFLKIPQVAAVTLEIGIHGKRKAIPWNMEKPVPVSEMIREGENQIEIRVTGSPRNLLGPFHLKGGKPLNTHDASFCPQESEYTQQYQTEPYGLLKKPQIWID